MIVRFKAGSNFLLSNWQCQWTLSPYQNFLILKVFETWKKKIFQWLLFATNFCQTSGTPKHSPIRTSNFTNNKRGVWQFVYCRSARQFPITAVPWRLFFGLQSLESSRQPMTCRIQNFTENTRNFSKLVGSNLRIGRSDPIESDRDGLDRIEQSRFALASMHRKLPMQNVRMTFLCRFVVKKGKF